MLPIAALTALICGAASLAGGLQGYIVKQSVPSLAGGGAIGVVLLVMAWLMWQGKNWAVVVAFLAAVALAGRFVPAWFKDMTNIWPALVMSLLGFATAVVQVVAFLRVQKG